MVCCSTCCEGSNWCCFKGEELFNVIGFLRSTCFDGEFEDLCSCSCADTFLFKLGFDLNFPSKSENFKLSLFVPGGMYFVEWVNLSQ